MIVFLSNSIMNFNRQKKNQYKQAVKTFHENVKGM